MVTFNESICSIAGSSEQSASIIAISPGLLAMHLIHELFKAGGCLPLNSPTQHS